MNCIQAPEIQKKKKVSRLLEMKYHGIIRKSYFRNKLPIMLRQQIKIEKEK